LGKQPVRDQLANIAGGPQYPFILTLFVFHILAKLMESAADSAF
jgi:hypothetical protein